MLKAYVYQNCDTCRKAIKFLKAHAVDFQVIPIRETPPTKTELTTMLRARNGDLRKLFNTSGNDYKAQNLKDKLPNLSTDDALALLAQNGNLVKRPFLIGPDVALNGFDEYAWAEALRRAHFLH